MEMIQTLLLFAGGLGMFLYGMDLMAEGLQQAAGDKTRKLLEALTKNPVMGLLAGALVTAIIQSSSAATVLVVGFVNAGLMSLVQACSVIMGANIGTTMTSWIVSMGEWAEFLKPEMIAPFLLLAGTFLHMMAKSKRLKDGAKILIGFGILFTGLSSMSGSIKPYADSPIFASIFETLGSNPLLAVLAGAGVTAVIQSSSASMGILQTMAMAGAVNWGSAVFIALGQNIGTCVTAMLSAVSGDTNAKRAAMIHLEFNVIGAGIVGAAAMIFFMIYPSIALSSVNSSSLAIFHTGFNLVTTLLLFPFRKQLVELSKLIIVRNHKHKKKKGALLLDSRLQLMPNAALSAMFRELELLKTRCAALILEASQTFENKEDNEKLFKEGRRIQDECMKVKEYCSEVDVSALTGSEQKALTRVLLSARDLHQIAEGAMRLAGLGLENKDMPALQDRQRHQIEKLCELSRTALSHVSLRILDSADTENTAEPGDVRRTHTEVEAIRNLISDMRQNLLEEMKEDPALARTSWLLFDAADRYEQIAFRALRLADEDAWQKNQTLLPAVLEPAVQPFGQPLPDAVC